jgi:ferric-dicitrate binding protein FerR (iron transport regulator)
MKTKEELIRSLFLDQCSREDLERLLQLIEEDQSETAPEIMTELFRQLDTLPETDASVSERIYRKVEMGLQESEELPERKATVRPGLRIRSYRRLGTAAAAVLVLVCAIWALPYLRAPEEILQQTAYGEVKELLLPDSTLVVLNGNSSLSYPASWASGSTRTVRLRGEAYFQVKKKPATRAKFQVMTSDLTVEVLGTAFNVNSYKDETRVFLEEGKVKVNLDHQTDKVVELAPGEAMRYSAVDQQYTPPEKVIEELQPNWRTGFIQFKETPLQLILEELSQTHELEFVILDTLLAKTKFDLALPTQRMEETMEILGRSTGASINRKGTQYILDSAPEKKE